MKIRIYDVGSQRKETTIEIPDALSPDEIAEAIYRAVGRMKALASREIECTWDSAARNGIVYAGWHAVGKSEEVT